MRKLPRKYSVGDASRSRGYTLMELMIAMTLGLIILSALVTLFSNSSRTHAELKKSAEHMGNGSMAMSVLTQDINRAGYYGEFYALPAASATLPDPCLVTPAALYAALAFSIQGYDAPAASPLTCLSNANYVPGTDILVVRYAQFETLEPADVPKVGEVYLQGKSSTTEVQIGAGNAAVGTTKRADGSVAGIFKKNGITAADIRKLSVQIYFIAPCSVPADGSDTCTGAADDGGRPIPTLKRLELTAVGATAGWRVAPLVEGIRSLQIDYGIDNSPNVQNPATNQFGDGVPDTYVIAPALADWANVVSVRIKFIAVSTQFTAGYVDTKTYDLGLAGTVGPFNDAFKKHLFAGTARLNDIGGRREIPK